MYTPSIGDQGGEGSCVGWAVGYTALGILMYPQYGNWYAARRSPNYVYNQIKQSSDCGSGSLTTNALNLVLNQGDCSWNSMPYVDGDCATLPNTTQQTEAAQNKALQWAALDKTDITGMKQAIDLGYPVVIAFAVYQSFKDMFNSGNGIWNANSGAFLGNHATCIVGYDDNKAMVKVQNQWGAAGGDQGFFWIPYTFIQSGCLKEAYILYATSPLASMTFSGTSNMCTSSTYTLNNLPANASLSWNSSSNLALSSTTSNSATFTASSNGAGWVQPVVNGVNLSKYSVWVGVPSQPTSIGGFPYDGFTLSSNSEYSFYLTLPDNQGINQYNWVLKPGSGTILDGQGTSAIDVETTKNSVSFYVRAQVGNTCGLSPTLTRTGSITSGGGTLLLSLAPNPSSDQVQVSLNTTDNITSAETVTTSASITSASSYVVKILDSYGQTYYSTTKSEKRFILPVSSLPNGVYTVAVSDGSTVYQKKLIVKH
ncbi:MAG: C1 family peptidase [Bacteroidota bacterium]|nr:C1 family peptidase [Bacteroidota bacterium]